MHGRLKVAAVIPARNEERLIGRTIWPVPDIVDTIYVVDDGSQDRTAEVVQHYGDSDPRIRLIQHKVNQGVGAAIITGYAQAYRDGHDVFVVVGGDAQMDWLDLDNLLQPIAEGKADYTKGNRFIYGSKNTPGNAWREMPTRRILGNVCCSILTKFASGYYHINDSQMGYTAIHKRAFKLVNWKAARKGYGYPAEWLMRFHSKGIRVSDVPVRAIYLSNERQTQIRVKKFLFYMMGIIVKGGIERINREYLFGRVTLPTISVPSITGPIWSAFQSMGARIKSLRIVERIGARIPYRIGLPSFFLRIRQSMSRGGIDKVFGVNVSLPRPSQIPDPVLFPSKESSTDKIIRYTNLIAREQKTHHGKGDQREFRFRDLLRSQRSVETELADRNHTNDDFKRMKEMVQKDDA
jgi:glycosyltransferase involved in cell wall biosynthesis